MIWMMTGNENPTSCGGSASVLGNAMTMIDSMTGNPLMGVKWVPRLAGATMSLTSASFAHLVNWRARRYLSTVQMPLPAPTYVSENVHEVQTGVVVLHSVRRIDFFED